MVRCGVFDLVSGASRQIKITVRAKKPGRTVNRASVSSPVFDPSGGNDTIIGGDGNDRIYGGGCNDSLQGGGGKDLIVGGGRNDAMNGGSGRDRLYARDGGRTRDSVVGGPGRDMCRVDKKDATSGCP